MFRGPIVITSLEEDFKKIGILIEEKEPVEPKVEASEEEEDDSDDAEAYIEGQENMSEEELAEARRIRRRTVKGKRSMKATKRTPASKRMKSKRNYRKKKMKIKLARRKKMRKPMVRRRAKFLAKRAAKRRAEGTDTISNLIEEVQDIVGSLNGGQQDAIKSFANIAIIADMLANTFTEWTNDITESDEEMEEGDETLDILKAASENLADLAEAAAEVATALKAGQELDGDVALEDIFREYMTDMLEGMDLYNEAAKSAKEEDEEGEDGEEVAEGEMPDFIKKKVAAKKDDDDEDEDDDDDDEDAEESVKGDKESSLKK